jgi:oxygen-dependent protoporphyrinogen oxidase
MQELVDAHVRRLDGKIRLDAPVTSLARNGVGWRVELESGERFEAEGVVVAQPPHAAAELLAGVAPVTSGGLREVESAAVTVVGLLYPRSAVDHPIDGYGFLVPGGKAPVLGCLFESSVFPNRAPAGKVFLRAMVGGARNREAALREPDRTIASVQDFLRPILGIAGEPDAVHTIRWDRAIPQYDVRHPARVERIERELAELPGLAATGAAYRGVSVNHLVAGAPAVLDRLEAGVGRGEASVRA